MGKVDANQIMEVNLLAGLSVKEQERCVKGTLLSIAELRRSFPSVLKHSF